jgi:hypothetical protein
MTTTEKPAMHPQVFAKTPATTLGLHNPSHENLGGLPNYTRCAWGNCKARIANRKYCTRHAQLAMTKCADCKRRLITTPGSSFCNVCMAKIQRALDAVDQAEWSELSHEEKKARADEVFANIARNNLPEEGKWL